MSTISRPLAIEAAAILQLLVRQTLEVMCFAESELLPGPAPDHNWSSSTSAQVNFTGTRAGRLALSTTPATARCLSAAFLGANEFHPAALEAAAQTIQELTRVMCARLVTSLDPTAEFQMTMAPALPAHDPQPAFRDAIDQTFQFGSGETLQVALRLC
jgi:hypothetical protein